VPRPLAIIRGRLATYPPDPLPLIREGGVGKRGVPPLSKVSSPSFNIVGIKRELKRGEASLNILPPLLFKERGIKGVRLINNLYYRGCLLLKFNKLLF